MRAIAKICQKMMSKYHNNLWKMDPGAHHKTMLKNIPQQIEKCSKNDSQLGPKKWAYFGGGASWGTFGGPNRFWTLKWAPSAPKVFPMIENEPKMIPKNPKIAKKSSKSQAFSRPGLADCAKRLHEYQWISSSLKSSSLKKPWKNNEKTMKNYEKPRIRWR